MCISRYLMTHLVSIPEPVLYVIYCISIKFGETNIWWFTKNLQLLIWRFASSWQNFHCMKSCVQVCCMSVEISIYPVSYCTNALILSSYIYKRPSSFTVHTPLKQSFSYICLSACVVFKLSLAKLGDFTEKKGHGCFTRPSRRGTLNLYELIANLQSISTTLESSLWGRDY